MKKIIHKLLCTTLICTGVSFYACQQDEYVVEKQHTIIETDKADTRNDNGSLYCNVTTTGVEQVDSLITVLAAKGNYPKASITHLTISGPINTNDISTMCKFKYLDSLVLTDAVIDKISSFSFTNFNSKAHIILPKSLKEIESHSFCHWYSYDSKCQAKSVFIPDSVATIGSNAFSNCRVLESVRLPKGLTNIENRVFYGCSELKEIEIPECVSKMDYEIFMDCQKLEKITLSDQISEMGHGVFSGCTSLDSIKWPKYLRDIPDATFSNCPKLKFEIPNVIKTIGANAFNGCKNITEYNIPNNVESIGEAAFAATGITSLIITSETILSNRLFKNCPIKSLTIQEGVESLPQYIFQECNQLESIKFPTSLKEIGNGAFYGCGLKTLELNKELTTMGNGVFRDNKSLTSVNINVKNIGNEAFQFCEKLENVILAEGLETIGYSCFYQTAIKEISLPTTLTEIGDEAFYKTSLTKIVLPTNLKTIGSNAFWSCIDLAEIEWNEGLESIGGASFYNTCIKSLVTPSSLKTLGKSAFNNIKSLKSITLNEGLTSIGHNCFSNTSITTATIPSTVTSCDVLIFDNCRKLTSIYWKTAIKAPDLYGHDTESNILLYLSNGQSSEYNANQIVNGKSKSSILLRSGGNFHCPESFVSDLRYERVFNRRHDYVHDNVNTDNDYAMNYGIQNIIGEASCWQTIVLPFTVTSIKCGDKELVPFGAEKEGAYPFWLRELTPNGFVKATKIEANKPYIIAMPNNEAYEDKYNISGKVVFSAENVTLPITEELKEVQGTTFNLYPTYTYLYTHAERFVINRIENHYDYNTGTDYYYGSVFIPSKYECPTFHAYVNDPTGSRSVIPIETSLSSRKAHKLGPKPQENDM